MSADSRPESPIENYSNSNSNFNSYNSISNTKRFKLNAPINALSLSPTGDSVIVAGREILKILSINDDGNVEEVLNLRAGSRINLNLSCSDVKWAPSVSRQNILATSATNGAVVIWDLGKSGGNKQDRILTDHTRAVNRITFHPTETFLLLSASQDGTMRLWDLRVRNAVMTFEGKSESARDVQFAPNATNDFAAAFENGNIQKWDVRSPKIYEKKLSAHNGLVLTLDWHPDGRYLASGGRDKVIKIWDMNSDARKPFHNLQTISSLSRVQWRPRQSSMMINSSPPHKSAMDPSNCIASCSLLSDNRIHVWNLDRPFIPQMSFEEHGNVVTGFLWKDADTVLSVSKDKYFVIRKYIDGFCPTESISRVATSWNSWNGISIVGKTQWATNQINEARLMSSVDRFFAKTSTADKFSGSMSTSNTITAGSWRGSTVPNFQAVLGSPNIEDSSVTTTAIERTFSRESSGIYDEDGLRTGVTSYFSRRLPRKSNVGSYSSVPGKPKEIKLNLFDPSRFQLVDFYMLNESGQGLEFAVYAMKWELDYTNENSVIESCLHNSAIAEQLEDLELCQVWGLLSDITIEQTHQNEDSFLQPYSFKDLILKTLEWLAETENVQMYAFVCVLFQKLVTLPTESKEWIYAYIDLLNKAQLFVESTFMIRNCPFEALQIMNQESTTFYTTCHRCFKPILSSQQQGSLRNDWFCEKCNRAMNSCSVCRLPVKSLYVWCRGCSHGGHLSHLKEWFENNDTCPLGCGHKCNM